MTCEDLATKDIAVNVQSLLHALCRLGPQRLRGDEISLPRLAKRLENKGKTAIQTWKSMESQVKPHGCGLFGFRGARLPGLPLPQHG